MTSRNPIQLFLFRAAVIYCMAGLCSPLFADTKLETLPLGLRNHFLNGQSQLDRWDGELATLAIAKKELDLVTKQAPTFFPARVELARYHIMLWAQFKDDSQLSRSREILESTIASDPKYPKPYVLLGHLCTLLREYRSAEVALAKAEALGTDDPWLHLNYADLYQRIGSDSEAKKRALRGLASDKANVKAVASAFETIYRTPDPVSSDLALEKLERKLTREFFSKEELFQLAQRLADGLRRSRGLAFPAEMVISSLHTRFPAYYGTYMAEATVVLNSGYRHDTGAFSVYDKDSIEAADELLSRALSIDPDNVDISLDIGNLYFNSQRIDEALEILRNSVPANEEDSRVSVLRGRILAAQNKDREAAQEFRNAIDAATSTDAVYTAKDQLAYLYSRTGQLDEAEKLYLAFIKDAPSSAWNYGNYASFLLYHRNDPVLAADYARKALAIMDYGVARNVLANALEQQQRSASRRAQ